MEGLIEGRMVHFVLPENRGYFPSVVGEHRPAIVVRVWDAKTGYVNLQVVVDGMNDCPNAKLAGCPLVWETSVVYDEAKAPGTWHWIERG